MDIMTLPTKETLVYLRTIDVWVFDEKKTDEGIFLIFKKNTPDKILSLFEDIKDNIDLKIIGYSIEE